MNEFGNYLFELRRKKGMTQQELADELGVTNKAVSNWETGETFPETKQLIPLADIFGVSVDDLLQGRESAAETKSPLSAQEQTAEKREIIIEKYLPDWWKKRFALLISVGVAFFLAGVLSMVSFSLATDSQFLHLIGACVLVGCIIIGTNFCMTTGIWQEFAFLPVKDENWHKRIKRFIIFLASGISIILLGVIAIILCCAFDDRAGFSTACYIPAFFLFAIGVCAIVYAGITWDGYLKKVIRTMEVTDTENAKVIFKRRNEHDTLAGKISGAIMLVATIAYFLLGFIWDLWHPGWIVYPVAALVCAIVNIFVEKK